MNKKANQRTYIKLFFENALPSGVVDLLVQFQEGFSAEGIRKLKSILILLLIVRLLRNSS